MKAVVVYKGALAHYFITQEKPDVFNASLLEYRGEGQPVPHITLVRGMRHWSGSVEDESLLQELGAAIDRNIPFDPLFPQRGQDSTIMDNLQPLFNSLVSLL
jgi:hypothetical protein